MIIYIYIALNKFVQSPKILTGSIFSLQIHLKKNYSDLKHIVAGTQTLETQVPIF